MNGVGGGGGGGGGSHVTHLFEQKTAVRTLISQSDNIHHHTVKLVGVGVGVIGWEEGGAKSPHKGVTGHNPPLLSLRASRVTERDVTG